MQVIELAIRWQEYMRLRAFIGGSSGGGSHVIVVHDEE